MRKFVAVAAVVFISLALFAQAGKPVPTTKPKPKPAVAVATAETGIKPAAEMPVKRVVLYKNGVGYFEHSGRVHGSQELNIRFTTAQLNDVLKSLTVVDLGGGRVTGVRYNSIAPLSERLSTLRIRWARTPTRSRCWARCAARAWKCAPPAEPSPGGCSRWKPCRRRTRDSETEFEVTLINVASEAGEIRASRWAPAPPSICSTPT